MCELGLASGQTRVTGTPAEGLPAATLSSDTGTELLKLFCLSQVVFKRPGRRGRIETQEKKELQFC